MTEYDLRNARGRARAATAIMRACDECGAVACHDAATRTVEVTAPAIRANIWLEHTPGAPMPLIHWHDAARPLVAVDGAWGAGDANSYHRRKATSFPRSWAELLDTLRAGLLATVDGLAFDPEPRDYYVTVVREAHGARKVGFLLGPFGSEAQAREHVTTARRLADEVDPRTAFDLFGVSSAAPGTGAPGVLNAAAWLDYPPGVVTPEGNVSLGNRSELRMGVANVTPRPARGRASRRLALCRRSRRICASREGRGMIAGGYTLDLYCRHVDTAPVYFGDDPTPPGSHRYTSTMTGGEQFFAETFGECKRASQRRGWVWGRDGDVTCPSCAVARR